MMQCSKQMMWVFTLTTASLLASLEARKLPTGLKGCSRNDPDLNACLLQSANAAVPYMSKGIPSYGVLPMDPMRIDEIAILDKGAQKQLALNLIMKNVDLVGLRNVKVNKISLSPDGGPASWNCNTPYLSLIGQYDVSGKVLILPIQGKGDINITMENVEYTYKFDVEKFTKGTKTGIRPANHSLDFKTSRITMRLENLFNGQKELSDQMNVFLNENWQELTNELGPPIAEALSAATNHRVEAIMRLVSLEEMFPDKKEPAAFRRPTMQRVRTKVTLCVFLLALQLATAAKNSKKLPSQLKPCSRNLSQPKLEACILENGKAAIPHLAKGIPSYNLLPLEPLHIPELRIDDAGTTSSINLNLVMSSVDITGLKNTHFISVKNDLKSGDVEWKFYMPQISLLGQYNVTGRVLLLPLRGHGDMNITLDDLEVNYSFRLKLLPPNKENVVYLKPEGNRLSFKTSKTHINLENLFEGQKALSDQMNIFLNENWRDLVTDLGPPIAEALSTATNQLMLTLTKQVPYDEIFPDTPV
ncbi:uncharacterized protein LOC132205255 [Neocloeon triangulifer]|uniref:uncharacterized protein LOC132205255 n=1 Tax=Neocloeon triangulifer TaxID=2078957 RepID=UPI00286F7FC3|nr:uncharacterized protein LOC132205255 [Neocloeon triangulifer]